MKVLTIIFLVVFGLISLLLFYGNEEPSTCFYMSEETAREMGKYSLIDYSVTKIPGKRRLNITGEIRNGSSSDLKYVRIRMIQYEEEAERSGEDYFPVYVKGILPGDFGEFQIENIPIMGAKHHRSVLTVDPPASRIMPWKFG